MALFLRHFHLLRPACEQHGILPLVRAYRYAASPPPSASAAAAAHCGALLPKLLFWRPLQLDFISNIEKRNKG